MLSMITNPRVRVRKRALHRIIIVRRIGMMRSFDLHMNINFQTTEYTEKINWNKETVTITPLTIFLNDDLLKTITKPLELSPSGIT